MTDKEPKIHPLVKVSSVIGILALATGQFGHKVSPTTPEATRTNTFPTLPVEPPVGFESATPTITTALSSEEQSTIIPTEGWKTPTEEEIESMLADPNFFTEPQGPSGRIIITDQFNNKEYERLDSQLLQQNFDSADYKGNSCSEAVIATLYKIFTYFKTGDVPDFTVADVINKLMIDEKYKDSHFIQPNGTNMPDGVFRQVIKLFGQNTDLFSVVSLTNVFDPENSQAVPGSKWSGLFRTAKRDVLNKGGILVAMVQKGGNPSGSLGHFITISSFNSGGEPLIIDSLNGSARVIGLGAYVDVQPGLLSLIGVIPTSK